MFRFFFSLIFFLPFFSSPLFLHNFYFFPYISFSFYFLLFFSIPYPIILSGFSFRFFSFIFFLSSYPISCILSFSLFRYFLFNFLKSFYLLFPPIYLFPFFTLSSFTFFAGAFILLFLFSFQDKMSDQLQAYTLCFEISSSSSFNPTYSIPHVPYWSIFDRVQLIKHKILTLPHSYPFNLITSDFDLSTRMLFTQRLSAPASRSWSLTSKSMTTEDRSSALPLPSIY